MNLYNMKLAQFQQSWLYVPAQGRDLLLLPAKWLGSTLIHAQPQGLFEYVAFHVVATRRVWGDVTPPQ